jgi:excinuclease ABC subunit B
VKSAILDLAAQLYDHDPAALPMAADAPNDVLEPKEMKRLIAEFTEEMQRAADEMEVEKAAGFRDRIVLLKDMELGLKPPSRSLLKAPVKAEETKPAPGSAGSRRGAGTRGRKRS